MISCFQMDSMANGQEPMVAPSVMSANYTMFQGTPNFVAELRLHSDLPATAAESELKPEILKKQSISLTQVNFTQSNIIFSNTRSILCLILI